MTRTTAASAPGYPTSPRAGPRRRRSGRAERARRASTRGWAPCGTSGARGGTTWSGAGRSGDTWTTVSEATRSRGHCHALFVPRSTPSNSREFYNYPQSWHSDTQLALCSARPCKITPLSLNDHTGRCLT